MSTFLTRFDAIEDAPSRTILYDDGQFDHVTVRDPETGLLTQRPIRATPEEQREVEVKNLRSNLASVEDALAGVEGLWPNEQLLPTERRERIEERRAGLEAERQVIYERLAALGAPVEERGRRR